MRDGGFSETTSADTYREKIKQAAKSEVSIAGEELVKNAEGKWVMTKAGKIQAAREVDQMLPVHVNGNWGGVKAVLHEKMDELNDVTGKNEETIEWHKKLVRSLRSRVGYLDKMVTKDEIDGGLFERVLDTFETEGAKAAVGKSIKNEYVDVRDETLAELGVAGNPEITAKCDRLAQAMVLAKLADGPPAEHVVGQAITDLPDQIRAWTYHDRYPKQESDTSGDEPTATEIEVVAELSGKKNRRSAKEVVESIWHGVSQFFAEGIKLDDKRVPGQGISRREFLRKAALATTVAAFTPGVVDAVNNVGRVISEGRSYGQAAKEIPVAEVPKNVWEKSTNFEENIGEVNRRLTRLEAVTLAMQSDSVTEDMKAEILRQQGITRQNWDRYVKMTNLTGIGVGEVLRVVGQTNKDEGGMAGRLVGVLEKTEHDNLGGVVELLGGEKDLKRTLLDQAAEKGILGRIYNSQGGKEALARLGYDVDSLEFKLETEFGRKKADEIGKKLEKDKMVLVMNDQGEQVLVIKSAQGHFVGKFHEQVKPEEIQKSRYVVERWMRMAESADGVKPDVDDLEKFVRWNYEQAVLDNKVANGGELSDDEKVQQEEYKTRMNSLFKGMVGGGMKFEEALQIKDQAMEGDCKSFVKMWKALGPGGRAVFRVGEKRRWPEFDNGNALTMAIKLANKNGGLNRENLTEAARILGENVFMIDVRSGEIPRDIYSNAGESGRGDEDTEKAFWQMMAGVTTMESYVDRQLKNQPLLYFDGNKEVGRYWPVFKLEGQISADLMKAVNGTEGPAWKNGAEFLKSLVGRNIKAAIPGIEGAVGGGASDPKIQMIEQFIGLTGSPYQTTFGEAPEGVRQAWRFSLKYTEELLFAVGLDRFPKHLLTEMEVAKQSEGEAGQKMQLIAGKLQSYLFSQLMEEIHGEEAVLRAYINSVPLAAAEGVPMYGLPAAAKYLFGKDVDTLNRGEMAILAGLIQQPGGYGPRSFELTNPEHPTYHEVDNSGVTRYRALAVVNIWEKNGVYTAEEVNEIRKQIEEVKFTNQFPDRMRNVIPEKALDWKTPVDLGPVSVVMGEKPQFRQVTPIAKSAEELGVENMDSPGQVLLSKEMKESISDGLIGVRTMEDSPTANVINDLWLNVTKLQGESTSWHEFAEKLRQYAAGKGIDNSLVDFGINMVDAGKYRYDEWQCGQVAILLGQMLAAETNNKYPYLFGFEKLDIAKDLAKPYFDNGENYTETTRAEYIRLDVDNPELINFLTPGDVVISYTGGNRDMGHVLMVADRGVVAGWDGKEIREERGLCLIDGNFEPGMLNKRWTTKEHLVENLHPNMAKHAVLIRPKGLEHGKEVSKWAFDHDSGRSDTPEGFAVKIDDRIGVIPSFQEGDPTSGGDNIIDFPGMAMEYFSETGKLEAEYDPSGMLSRVPVSVGNALKVFETAFFEYRYRRGLTNKDPRTEYYRSEVTDISLEDEDEENWMANTSPYGKVANGHRKLPQAMAWTLDVPFHFAMKTAIKEDPETWNEFMQFCDRFGLSLTDYVGNSLTQAPRLGATGRDVYTSSLDRLTYAMTVFANSETMFDGEEDRDLVESAKFAMEAVFDKEERRKAMERTGGEGRENDPWRLGANTICDVKDGVLIGTRLGTQDVQINMQPTENGFKVGAGVVRGQQYTMQERAALHGLPEANEVGLMAVQNTLSGVGTLVGGPMLLEGMEVVLEVTNVDKAELSRMRGVRGTLK